MQRSPISLIHSLAGTDKRCKERVRAHACERSSFECGKVCAVYATARCMLSCLKSEHRCRVIFTCIHNPHLRHATQAHTHTRARALAPWLIGKRKDDSLDAKRDISTYSNEANTHTHTHPNRIESKKNLDSSRKNARDKSMEWRTLHQCTLSRDTWDRVIRKYQWKQIPNIENGGELPSHRHCWWCGGAGGGEFEAKLFSDVKLEPLLCTMTQYVGKRE